MTGRPPRDARPNQPAEQSPATVELRFHGDLTDFLPVALREATVRRHILGRPAVKDVLEAAGVPHPEIALVLVNGVPAGFDRRLEPGDRVDAYPAGWRGAGRLPPGLALGRPPGEARFVLDGHLGRLAAYLRMCGFDTVYRRDAADHELARLADAEDRILLTRDVGLLKRSVVGRGAFVRSERPPDQLVEILRRFDLARRLRPFARCLRCNGQLEPVARESVQGEVPPRVYREQLAFSRCPDCHGVYWRGSHHARMSRLLAHALEGGGVQVIWPDPGPVDEAPPERPRTGRAAAVPDQRLWRAPRKGVTISASRKEDLEMSAAHEPTEVIGTVTHWFGHLSVAAVNLTAPVAIGDRVHVLGHVTDLVQTIRSMEVDHRKVERAAPGDDVAIAFDDHVREHDRIYREP